MWRNNTVVGDITLYVQDKGGHHSVFGHISVQNEKYYIISIKKWLYGNRFLHLYRELLALGRKIDIFKPIYRYLIAFGR
jgi:hypothetical protein